MNERIEYHLAIMFMNTYISFCKENSKFETSLFKLPFFELKWIIFRIDFVDNFRPHQFFNRPNFSYM